jgi:riboflavin kinase/FMN adenylyltransferase
MLAKVVEGRKIGRTLGFPTANLEFLSADDKPHQSGVYVVDVGVDDLSFRGLLNVGVRPTFGVSEKIAEVHILNFDQNIYGKTLNIKILKYLREERAFDTPGALVEQINMDRIEALK